MLVHSTFREKSRITLSIKQLEEDPLLETLEKVIPQDGEFASDAFNMSDNLNLEPLPGLDSICKELVQEDGITDVRLGRQGLEKVDSKGRCIITDHGLLCFSYAWTSS